MRFFLRIENWLLIIPLLLLLIRKIYFPGSMVDFYMYDTIFIISGAQLLSAILLVCLLLYVCHMLLRVKNTRNKKILLVHIIVTLLLVLYLLGVIFFRPMETGLAGVPRRYYDFPDGPHHVYAVNSTDGYIAVACLLFVLMQLLFVLYAIIRLIIKK